MSATEEQLHKLSEKIHDLSLENQALKQELDAIKKDEQSKVPQVIRTTFRGVKFWAGADLRKSFDRVYQELPAVTKPAFAQLSASIVKRFTRIGLFAILFAVIPALFILIQTIILFQQNGKLEIQNQKIQQQVYLEEASRRNNLVFLMDSTLDQINDEVSNTSDRLSQPLIGRIKSLVYGFRPYRFLENDKLTQPLSVEKGQFLLALMNSGINKQSIDQIFQASFSNVYLKKVSLFGKVLENIEMPNADLQEADLSLTSFKGANMHDTNFSGARLGRANLMDTDLRNAQFKNTNLNNAQLDAALLENASFEGADLREASLDKAHVANKDWFEQLKKWNVIGTDAIIATYTLDGPHTNELEKEFYILERKKNAN